jgi:hypothetical protein
MDMGDGQVSIFGFRYMDPISDLLFRIHDMGYGVSHWAILDVDLGGSAGATWSSIEDRCSPEWKVPVRQYMGTLGRYGNVW